MTADLRPGRQYDPQISCIVCTYNRVGLLRRVLEAFLGQTLPRTEFEVILVDDGSTDDVGPLAAHYQAMLPLRLIRQENRGLGAAKNAGVAAARAPIVIFMDDDDAPAPSLLGEHLRMHATHPRTNIAVLGHTNLHPEIATRPLMRFVTDVGCYLFSYARISDGAVLDYTWFWGGRSSCKRGLLPSPRPFNPVFRFGCEDIELGYRLSAHGLKVIYHRSAVTTMLRAFSLDGFCRRTELQGCSNWLFSRLHPAPEIQVWTGVEDAFRIWAHVGPQYDRTLQAARHLDRLAQGRADQGVVTNRMFSDLLHRAYWKVLNASRAKGIVAAASEADAEWSRPPAESATVPC
ncbi:MAG: glycosyltransferase family 2 protein [Rhizomicrobium sp.]